MATIQKPVKLVNPGSRGPRKRLTLRQKLHFGTKRQRAHAKEVLGRRNPQRRKRTVERRDVGKGGVGIYGHSRKTRRAIAKGDYRKATYYAQRTNERRKKHQAHRLPNVGEIITIYPASTLAGNPGTRKKGKNKGMARPHRKGHISHQAAVRRARKAARTRARHRSNPGVVRHRRRSYRRRRSNGPATVIRYRRRNTARHHRRYRRNPGLGGGMFKSKFGQAVGIIAGAFVTKVATGFLPAQFNTGIIGYVATALVATFQGQMIGKLLKNPSLGADMQMGGYVYLALKIANDYFPSLSLPFGLSGMGIIGPSSFWTPQVALNGSMGQFVNPAQLMGAIPAPQPVAGGMRGMGVVRRMGRMR